MKQQILVTLKSSETKSSLHWSSKAAQVTMALHFLFCVTLCTTALALPPTEPPLIKNLPFVAIWNAPIDQCRRHEIPLDTGAFQALTTPAAVPGQFLTLFYEDRLGNYPKIENNNPEKYENAIPQCSNLTKHLDKARSQIDYYFHKDSAPGLAVIDWESWRPLWDQNWGSKRIYQRVSINYVREKAPTLSPKKILELAKHQFEHAGRAFMQKTLSLGIDMRPSRRWGFYLYPDCHNYNWETPGYTGKCRAHIQKQNDEMLWLWKHSTALFPSIYLHRSLRNSDRAALYVRNRVQEAHRVASLPKNPYTAPVYVYARPLYRDQNQKFLTEMDLVSTVGECAALGASGVVMWGASRDYATEHACQSLSTYLTSFFNRYITNVTAAALLCSETLCQGKGRCVRKNYDSDHYLHLNPTCFTILQSDRRYGAVGLPSEADLNYWATEFTCQCYAGSRCSAKLVRPTKIQQIWL